jgi:hypothetical protein
MISVKEQMIFGLTGGVLCIGKEVKKSWHTRVFRIYFKWPCDNPRIEPKNINHN